MTALPGPPVPETWQMIAVTPGAHSPSRGHPETIAWWTAQPHRIAERLGL